MSKRRRKQTRISDPLFNDLTKLLQKIVKTPAGLSLFCLALGAWFVIAFGWWVGWGFILIGAAILAYLLITLI